jgi:hypothetical protein
MKIAWALAVAAGMALSTSAYAATAFFTGRQEMVQTVTYQMAWKCYYSYAGQTFTAIFKDSCPSSIEVE